MSVHHHKQAELAGAVSYTAFGRIGFGINETFGVCEQVLLLSRSFQMYVDQSGYGSSSRRKRCGHILHPCFLTEVAQAGNWRDNSPQTSCRVCLPSKSALWLLERQHLESRLGEGGVRSSKGTEYTHRGSSEGDRTCPERPNSKYSDVDQRSRFSTRL